MENMAIRKIEERDRDEFLSMSADFYSSDAVLHDVDPEYHKRAFDELMSSDTYTECFIFESDGEVAGFAMLCKSYSREAGGHVIMIDELYIKPAYRGHGIGSTFFRLLEDKIPAARYRLEVEPDNVKALKLYRRMGYRELPYLQMIKE